MFIFLRASESDHKHRSHHQRASTASLIQNFQCLGDIGLLIEPVLATGKTKTGRLWTYRDDRPFGGPDPPAAVYFYR
jgi:hypothetical protein